MKAKSLSGLVFYVKDLNKTAKFYETLGFQITKNDSDHLAMRLNWFSMDFLPQDKEDKPGFKEEAGLVNRGSGVYVYLSVDDVDEFYKHLLSKGLKPSTEPRDWPWGNREFVIRDPDGYKLVLFRRKKARNPAE